MITQEKYIELLDAGYSMDVLYLLQALKEGETFQHPKVDAYIQMMKRKELLTDDLELTLAGDALLAFLDEKATKLVTKLVTKTEDFNTWWDSYPATNMFIHKGKTFTGTQTKRIKKADCKQLFNKYVNEGMKADDIIAATQFHILTAKNESTKLGKNQLSFIPNSERYLRERVFEPFIAILKESQSTAQEEYDGVNI